MANKITQKQQPKIWQTVWVITKCKDIASVLDGSLWGRNGDPGSATGYYCPYEDKCPHEDSGDFDCEKFEDALAVFEDTIETLTIDEIGTYISIRFCGKQQYLGEGICKTKEEAESALKCISTERLGIFDAKK